MDVYSLLNVSNDSLWCPVNNDKTFRADWVSFRGAMLVDRGWGLKCSLSLSPKVLPDAPIYSSGQLICGNLNL